MNHFLMCLASTSLLIAGSLSGTIGSRAIADDSGITVSAIGEAKAMPNLAEFTITVGGADKKAADAVKKYEETLKRTVKAFEELKLPDLTVRQSAITYQIAGDSDGIAMFGGFGGSGTPKVSEGNYIVSRTLTLRLSGIAKRSEDEINATMAKIMDKAKDANVTLGGGESSTNQMLAMMGGGQSSVSTVTFVLEKPEAIRKQAYQDAFSKSQTKAEQLASLAELKLGRPTSIQAISVASANGQNAQENIMRTIYGIGLDEQEVADRVTSKKFEEVKLRVSLRVRFSTQ